MIKIKRILGKANIKVKGELTPIIEELLTVTVHIIKTMVKNGTIPKDNVDGFIDDFARQVKRCMSENNDK